MISVPVGTGDISYRTSDILLKDAKFYDIIEV